MHVYLKILIFLLKIRNAVFEKNSALRKPEYLPETPNPCDLSQGFGAGLVGNYMKMNGVVFMEQNLGSVSVILSISVMSEFMMWHL